MLLVANVSWEIQKNLINQKYYVRYLSSVFLTFNLSDVYLTMKESFPFLKNKNNLSALYFVFDKDKRKLL